MKTLSFIAALSLLAISVYADTYTNTVKAWGPAGAYRLSQISGNMIDYSGHGRDLTFSGGGTRGIGGPISDGDLALQCDGTTIINGVTTAFVPGSSDFTIEAWVKYTTNVLQVVAAQSDSGPSGDYYGLIINAGGHIGVFAKGATRAIDATSAIANNDGNWHLVDGVETASALTLYVDGVFVTNSLPAGACSPTGNFTIGRWGDYSGGFQYTEKIDEVAFYLSALSASQVLSNYNAAFPNPTMGVSPASVYPHTSGIVVTLSGAATSWSGSTVFTVTGATKTAQNISSATSATVTITTPASAGTATIVESVTGATSNAVTILNYKDIAVTSAGTDFRIYEPANYTGQVVKAVPYHHGAGGDRDALLPSTSGIVGPVFDAFWRDGYLMWSVSSGDGFGCQNEINAYSNAWTYINAHYPVSGMCIFCGSMGGISALNCVQQNIYGNRLNGLYLIYPVCSLNAMFGTNSALFAGTIRAAYGIASDGSDYAAKTAGYDPLLAPVSKFENLYYKFHHSAGDTIVFKAQNTDPFSLLLTNHVYLDVVIPTSGDHGDASNIDVSDSTNYFNQVFGGCERGMP